MTAIYHFWDEVNMMRLKFKESWIDFFLSRAPARHVNYDFPRRLQWNSDCDSSRLFRLLLNAFIHHRLFFLFFLSWWLFECCYKQRGVDMLSFSVAKYLFSGAKRLDSHSLIFFNVDRAYINNFWGLHNRLQFPRDSQSICNNHKL